jgi:hypothetical protein
VGILTGLLLLPLAPVRGTVWLAERLQEEAERQRDPNERLRLELQALQLRHELGELTESELEEAEDDLLALYGPDTDEAASPPTKEVVSYGDIDDQRHAEETRPGA